MSPTYRRPVRQPRAFIWLAAATVGLCQATLAELPAPRLESLFPPGARAGSTVEVTATGTDLDDGETLRFSAPGFLVKLAAATTNKAVVSVGSQVPPGLYEAAWVGRFGSSNPRIFVVGDLPELLSSSTNQSRETASRLALGTTVNGKVTAGRSDYFRFPAKQGQHVVIQCSAAEIDSRLEPSLWLFDGTGREIGRSRRTGLVDFTAVRDGEYILRIHDFLNRGGEAYFYRLSISTNPQVLYTSPLSALPGTNRLVTLYGRNLPGGKPSKELGADGKPLESLSVSLRVPGDDTGATPLGAGLQLDPSAAGLDAFSYQLPSRSGAARPILLSVAQVPVLTETEPNDTSEKAQTLSIPAEVNGLFRGRKDRDYFQFEAKKGQTWVLEIISQRLGYETDPALLVQRIARDAAGKEKVSEVQEGNDTDANLGGIDFKTSSGDPSVRVEVKEDGLYQVLVRDQSTLPNEQQVRPYRLIIRPPMPDFRLTVMPATPPGPNKDSKELKSRPCLLRAGGTLALRVIASRRDGLNTPIDIRAENLPAGVRSQGVQLAGDAQSTLLILSAGEGLTNWTGAIRILGRSQTPQGERQHESRVATLVRPVPNYEAEAVRTRFTEVEPLQLTLGASAPVEATAGAKLTIPLLVQRKGDFGANLKLRLLGHPTLGGGKEIEIDKQATQAVFEVNLGETKIPEGTHLLHVETLATFQAPRSASGLSQAEIDKASAEKLLPVLKESQDKAKAALETATKAAEKAEAEAKAAPDKQPVAQQAKEAKVASTKQVEELGQKLEAATKAKVAAEERIKLFVKREFSESFFSSPVLVKILPTKPK